jgi:hypothetical protein
MVAGVWAGQVSAACNRSVTMLAMPNARLPVASCSIMRSYLQYANAFAEAGQAGSMPIPPGLPAWLFRARRQVVPGHPE